MTVDQLLKIRRLAQLSGELEKHYRDMDGSARFHRVRDRLLEQLEDAFKDCDTDAQMMWAMAVLRAYRSCDGIASCMWFIEFLDAHRDALRDATRIECAILTGINKTRRK